MKPPKTYVVTVNGERYSVIVEEAPDGGGTINPAAVSAPKSEPKQATVTAPVPAPPAPKADTNGNQVVSPLPGTLVSYKVKVGDVVAKNDVVAVVEAMKMENDIVTPHGGRVLALCVSPGTAVAVSDALLTVEE